MWWNFIGRSHEEIVEAREAWQRTITRSEAGTLQNTDAFGLPDNEPEPPLPAPEVPIARLKPRGHLPPLPTGPALETAPAAPAPAAPAAAADDAHVVHEPDKNRYEIWLGDTLAGFTEYRDRPRGLAFTHTEVFPEFGGRGLAGKLVSQALADVRASGSKIIPYCPYVAVWIKKHPEYEEITVWPAP